MSRKIQEIDLRGLKCPLVVLKIAKEFKQRKFGDILKVKFDDPKAENDIEELSKNINIKILKKEKSKKPHLFFIFMLKKY
ncbi:MAG: hypothetical protein CMM95_01120 [Rickettsiales bacterium]|nr:hypothetical protein [Rickettsiales bacterium]|tara:strand:- start:1768 stop:2007 length:240 start_codon:yes stop_codon:yes gene_type:complete